MSVKRYEVNGSSSVFEDENGILVDYDDYVSLEVKLDESLRYGRQADATIHNLELQLTDMAVQLANAESKCRELAAENESMHETIEAVRSVADNSSGIAGWHLNGDIATWEEILPEINEIKTQATDAFLAEVRAQGVEMLADDLLCPDLDDSIREFASQLRKGAAL